MLEPLIKEIDTIGDAKYEDAIPVPEEDAEKVTLR